MQGSQVCKMRLDSAQGVIFLVSLRTLDLILAGDGNAAADSIMSTLKLSRVFDTHPTMLVQGRKMICIRLALSDIQILLARCRPSEDRLNRLQSLVDETFSSDSLKKSLLAERVYQLEVARNLIPRHIASQYLEANIYNMPERLAIPIYMASYARIFCLCEIPGRYGRTHKVSSRPWPTRWMN